MEKDKELKQLNQSFTQMVDKITSDMSWNDAGFVGQVIVNELKHSINVNLVDAEQALREINSRIYLLALPLESFGAEFDTFYPNSDSKYPYALWICVNGKEEAKRTMEKHGFDEFENNIRLQSCGFLTKKI